MQSKTEWILNNWPMKVASLVLAALLWGAISNQASSEVNVEVPLEYRNIPPQIEITGDMTSMVNVRLRGSSSVIRDVSVKEVSANVDLAGMEVGEKIIPLSQQNVSTPFGAEVIRVNPSSIRFTLERTLRKKVPIVPSIQGEAPEGYEIREVLVSPSEIEIEGPESRVNSLSSVATVPLRLEGDKTFEQSVDVDVQDPQIRLLYHEPIKVKINIQVKH